MHIWLFSWCSYLLSLFVLCSFTWFCLVYCLLVFSWLVGGGLGCLLIGWFGLLVWFAWLAGWLLGSFLVLPVFVKAVVVFQHVHLSSGGGSPCRTQGYGILDKIPAFYLLWWIHPDVANGSIRSMLGSDELLVSMLKNGYQSLWKNMAKRHSDQVNYITGAQVTAIKRTPSVEIKCLDSYCVGSLGFNFLGNQGVFH